MILKISKVIADINKVGSGLHTVCNNNILYEINYNILLNQLEL